MSKVSETVSETNSDTISIDLEDNKKIFAPKKNDICYYFNKMKQIKAQQDQEKENERKRIRQLRRTGYEKYQELNEDEKRYLKEFWLNLFPLGKNTLESFLQPLTEEELDNYANSKINRKIYEIYCIYGSEYRFKDIFYNFPNDSKGIQYPYKKEAIVQESRIEQIALKKIFHQYLDITISYMKEELREVHDLSIKSRIKLFKEKINDYLRLHPLETKKDIKR